MGAVPNDTLQRGIAPPASAMGSLYPRSTADVFSQAGALCKTALQLREAAQRLHEQIQRTYGEEDRSQTVLWPDSGSRRPARPAERPALHCVPSQVLRERAQVLRRNSRLARERAQVVRQRNQTVQQRAGEAAVWAVAADERALEVGMRTTSADD